MMKLSSILYNNGKWYQPWQECHLLKRCKDQDFKPKNNSKMQMTFVMGFNVINFGLLIFGICKHSTLTVPNYFLFLFISNLMIYFFYYCCMKIVHKEPIPTIGYILAITCYPPTPVY